ncbi:MAG: hypothetical protein ACREC6_01980 [Hyphomicrobiaceae bacterium]
MRESDSLAGARIYALAEHYQATYEVAVRFWDQRNRMFLLLGSVIAAGAALTYLEDATIRILTAQASNLGAGAQDKTAPDVARAFRMSIAFLDVAVFYLTMNLYQNTVSVRRYYEYLDWLERELRDVLQLADTSVAFSREGAFYRARKRAMSRFIAYSYYLVVGFMLGLYFALRLLADLGHATLAPAAGVMAWVQHNLLLFLDVFTGFLTLLVFLAYVRSNVLSRHRRSVPVKEDNG